MNWKDVIALVVVSTLGASVMMSVAALAWRDKQLSQAGADVLTIAITGLVSLASYHMGNRDA
jgi:hypothetical protein